MTPGSRAARIGLIVPRYRQSAVSRNKVKRRLRELVRLELLPTLCGMEVVVRARPEAYDATMAALREDICAGRARLQRLAAAGRTGDAP